MIQDYIQHIKLTPQEKAIVSYIQEHPESVLHHNAKENYNGNVYCRSRLMRRRCRFRPFRHPRCRRQGAAGRAPFVVGGDENPAPDHGKRRRHFRFQCEDGRRQWCQSQGDT